MLTSNTKYQGRIHFMDTVRGVIILGIVVYHTLFDLAFVFGIKPMQTVMTFWLADFIRDWGAGMMILMCGICCRLSRSNLKRGIECLIVSLLLSLVTFFFMRDEFIYFGILHFLALAMLLYVLLQKVIDRIPWWVSIITFVAFLFAFGIPSGYFGVCYQKFVILPEMTAHLPALQLGSVTVKMDWVNYVLVCLGLPARVAVGSGDYFPVIPWILMFFTGTILGKFFKEGHVPKWFYKDICKPITWMGTKTLWIYLLHQPVVYGIIYGIFWLTHRG